VAPTDVDDIFMADVLYEEQEHVDLQRHTAADGSPHGLTRG